MGRRWRRRANSRLLFRLSRRCLIFDEVVETFRDAVLLVQCVELFLASLNLIVMSFPKVGGRRGSSSGLRYRYRGRVFVEVLGGSQGSLALFQRCSLRWWVARRFRTLDL